MLLLLADTAVSTLVLSIRYSQYIISQSEIFTKLVFECLVYFTGVHEVRDIVVGLGVEVCLLQLAELLLDREVGLGFSHL